MKSFRLTPQAEARLTEIALWTIDRFGVDQARRYERDLIDRLHTLASGDPPHGKSCSTLVSGGHPVANLYYYRQGQHYIIYRDSPALLIVIDFLHGSRNLPRILEDLAK
ncbi:MAG: type II toxin-antitoxin system RelE/ParE family toxin [Chromatiales bacterium]